MSEPGYGSYAYLLREVGSVLGYGRHPDSWTPEKRSIADGIVQRGVRGFYVPTVLPNEKYAHEWSFLRPVRPLVTVANQYIYDLPADFAMLDGPITYAPDQAVLYQPIEVVAEYVVRTRQQETTWTGRPTMAALVSTNEPGRFQIHFWVTPDGAYTLYYRSRVNPRDLSDANPTPHGGMVHAQTILEACLLEAELEKGVKDSPRKGRFLERLQASVSHDRRLHSPPSIRGNVEGYGVDSYHELDANVIKYNGVEY